MLAGGTRWLIAWIIVGFVGVLTLTQAFGWAGTRTVAIVQSLTPYMGLALVPVVLVALWRGHLRLATVGAAIGFGMLVMAAPLAFPDGQADPLAGADGLRVASMNLLYGNERIEDVAAVVQELAPDVIVFSEYTADHQAALQHHPLARSYPYRIDRSGQYSGGVALWSRYSVAVDEFPDTYNYSLDVTVAGVDGDTRIVAMHVPTPLMSFVDWRRDLDIAAQFGRDATGPTMVIGDLNSSYWHPDFRRLLDSGFVDAHIANDRGFSTSWPTDRFFPPFVRLDHALVAGGLVATDVVDVEIPGSDHRGFVVTVVPAAPATP